MEWLKKLLNITSHFHFKNVNLFSNNEIQFNFGSEQKNPQLSLEEAIEQYGELKLKQLLLEEFEQGNIRFIERNFSSSSDTLVNQNLLQNSLLNKLAKLAPKYIPTNDILILKACLLLRYQFEHDLKEYVWTRHQISQDYGQRGRNISNLFTAKYYETLILEMYKELQDQPNSVEQFKYMYEIIVNEYPFAVFINTTMTVEEIKEAIVRKLQSMNKYNVNNLHVHGLGQKNVKNINRAILEMSESTIYHDWQFNTTSTNKAIMVQIATEAKN